MTGSSPTPRRRVVLVLCVGLGAAVAAVAVWNRPDQPAPPPPAVEQPRQPVPELEPPPADPRVAFATPYRNVRPDVKYLGDTACTPCHESIARTYHQHPMGRSAEWVSRGPASHATGPNNPFASLGYTLRVERMGESVRHLVGLAEGGADSPVYSVTADLAIGSGTHGRSYLTTDRGAVWQSPVSWFAQPGRWDVSPGFDLAKELRRPILPQCLHCHTDQPEPIPGSLNRYREPLLPRQANIGCERCHGPGELHVAERGRGEAPMPDLSIVNPARLPAELKADVCRQCHLQGRVQVPRRGRDASEYRPGLPWEQFVATFLWHPDLTDYRNSVGQFEQMEKSRCFSGGKLSCTSCHDPHAKPTAASTAAFFRGKCMSCHDSRGCSLPAAGRAGNGDNCIACHMPARDSTNITHVAVTDHRIMKRPDDGRPRTKVLAPGEMPLVVYKSGPRPSGAAERGREWAIALSGEFARGGSSPDRWRVVDTALDRALERWPEDVAAMLARSRAHAARGMGTTAIEAARAATAVAPDSEVALGQLAGAEIAADDYEAAAQTADKLIALNPSSADHRLTRATAFFSRGDWAKAEADCRAALAIQPVRPNARFMLAVCAHKRGDAAGGRRELDLALKLTPTSEGRASLSKWYEQLTR